MATRRGFRQGVAWLISHSPTVDASADDTGLNGHGRPTSAAPCSSGPGLLSPRLPSSHVRCRARHGARVGCGGRSRLALPLQRTHPGDVAGTGADGPFVCAQTLIRSTPQSHDEKVPAADASTGRLLVSWIRLDNRDELARVFGWSRAEAQCAPDPDYVFAAYQRWDTACADRLEGDFAFALWDPERRRVFAARDSTGIRPLFYAETPDAFVCATTAAVLDAVPDVDRSVRPEWVAQYLHGRSPEWTETAFAGVRRLPPGHWLVADETGVTDQRYHQFRDDAPWQDTREAHWLDEYRERLFAAVQARIRTDQPIGVENSGGLDSATMVSLIPHLDRSTRATMHTFGFAVSSLEPEYIEAVRTAAGVRESHVWSQYGAGALWDNQRIGYRTLGYPVEHGNAVGHVAFYEVAAEHGIRTLHSGHGGDEVVTQSAGLVTTELLDRRRYATLLRDLPGGPVARPARLARSWWRNRGERTSHLMQPMMSRLAGTPLTPEAFEAADIAGRTRRAAAYDAPFRTVNEFILGDRWSVATSVRTADCSVVAASYGIDYVWPLLDRRLMQQYLSTPAIWKFGEGYGRYLHRRAVSGIVPDKIAWKASKSMLGPGESPGRPPSIVGGPPRPWQDLHPAVRELIDPQRWQRGPDPTVGGLADQPYRNAVVVSDWLDDRG